MIVETTGDFQVEPSYQYHQQAVLPPSNLYVNQFTLQFVEQNQEDQRENIEIKKSESNPSVLPSFLLDQGCSTRKASMTQFSNSRNNLSLPYLPLPCYILKRTTITMIKQIICRIRRLGN